MGIFDAKHIKDVSYTMRLHLDKQKTGFVHLKRYSYEHHFSKLTFKINLQYTPGI